MGFRFRRSIKLAPGVRVNLSKSGISTSLGRPGLTVNLRGDRVKTTAGSPGTGISYSETAKSSGPSPIGAAVLLFLVAILFFLWLTNS